MNITLPAPDKKESPELLIIAGEHSGDQHAAGMLQAALSIRPNIHVCSLGGPALESAGCQLLFDLTQSSVVGFWEVIKQYSFFKAIFDAIIQWIELYKPKCICFVDYPGLNLRLAKALYQRKLSIQSGGAIKIIYYISPQVWAWKAKRIYLMAKVLDHLAVILPFEVACFDQTQLPVTFVGHPFLSKEHEQLLQYDPKGPVLLLPGSRKAAITYILPILLKAFKGFAMRYGHTNTCILVPDKNIQHLIQSIIVKELEPAIANRIQIDLAGQPIRASVVLTSSGTMSLNAALAGIPGVIVYKCSLFTYFIGRWFIKIPYLGLANIILNKIMYPEYIQHAIDTHILAQEIHACLTNVERIRGVQQDSQQLKAVLGVEHTMSAGAWLLNQLN